MLNRRSFCLALAFTAAPQVLAAACTPLLPQLSLCDASGWRLDRIEDNIRYLSHDSGVTATVRLATGLSEDQIAGERWMISHAPISARAEVLATDLFQVGTQYGSTVAYLPRHADPAIVVVLSDIIGRDFALVITTQETGVNTYTDAHKTAHDRLLAALQLDLPE
ncbi:MAG: hypothetical protein ACKO1H_18415 [Tabrizicola sp.]